MPTVTGKPVRASTLTVYKRKSLHNGAVCAGHNVTLFIQLRMPSHGAVREGTSCYFHAQANAPNHHSYFARGSHFA